MSKVAVVGAGYVGITTAVCLAELGHHVVGVDIDEGRVKQLKRNRLPIFEPGLEEMLQRNAEAGRISFTTCFEEAIPDADFAFIAVATPEAEGVAGLYGGLGAQVLLTDINSAEMIKYASNAFLATRISFINEIARISERVGADVTTVARGMGMDERIGPHFLQAGLGYGGSCFPKDVKALASIAHRRDAYGAARGADAAILVTEWNEFRQLDLDRLRKVMRRPVFVDGRNLYDPARMRAHGFEYRGIGRD